MSMFEPSPYRDRMLAVLRIVAGAVFVSTGTALLFAYPPSPQPMPPLRFLSQLWIGAVLEIVGGLLIVVGLFTRPVAFVLAGEMAVAYFQFHFPRSFFPSVNEGRPAVLYCFVYLYLWAAGPGAWSLDRMIARSRAVRR